MKITRKKSYFRFSLLSHSRSCLGFVISSENYYGQFGQYNGKAKIDDSYEMIADGAEMQVLTEINDTWGRSDEKKYGSYINYNQIRAGETYHSAFQYEVDNPYYYKGTTI